MLARRLIPVVGCILLASGCAAPPDDTQEIIDNLVKAGFPVDDIMDVDGAVYVGRDAEVSLAASREMLQASDSHEEQYRTTNLISSSLTKICINGSTFTGVFSTALDLAIRNYDEQPLTFAMARTPSSGCSFTINAVIQPGVVGGSSGFPSGGLPFGTINIGGGLSTFSVDTIEHVITHEIGHTIGFRHSDFFNRSISCGGSAVNEGDGGIGAIHIPGTPTGATVGGSIMNSCFRTVETGEFTATDLTALRGLYFPDPTTRTFVSSDVPKNIPDNNASGVASVIDVSAGLSNMRRVTVDVSITHTFIGDLVIQVIAPNGQIATLSDRQGGSTDNFVAVGRDISASFSLGISPSGTWRLLVRDLAGADVGTIDSFALHITSNATNDFNIMVTPTSRTINAGGVTTYAINTAVSSGVAQQIVLSVSGLPFSPTRGGIVGSFSPSSVIAGESSTLTLDDNPFVFIGTFGTFQFSITGTDGLTTRTIGASITVLEPVVNPGI